MSAIKTLEKMMQVNDVEAVAKALCKLHWHDDWTEYGADAKAAIKALKKQGWTPPSP